MKITEIRNLDLFKYSLIILAGSIALLLFPFIFFFFHYKQQGKSYLVNFYYIFTCFGVAVLLLNSFLLFWILNSQVKSNNRQQVLHFETHFFQLLNYLHETASRLDRQTLEAVNHSIRNLLLDNKNDTQHTKETVQVLMSTLRNSALKNESSETSEFYFRQLNTLLLFVFADERAGIETGKYIAILEAQLH